MVEVPQLNDDEKRELLRIARATLREFTNSGRIPPGKPHRESLLCSRAAFVSLHREGALRGCIGVHSAQTPLYRTVQEMAIAAASRDHRFPELTRDELPTVEIEVSVLGSFRAIKASSDITVGVDGLALEIEDRRGILLPQVALAAGWDASQFLANLCHKAGVQPEAWRHESAKLEAFTAEVFSDQTHPPATPRRR